MKPQIVSHSNYICQNIQILKRLPNWKCTKETSNLDKRTYKKISLQIRNGVDWVGLQRGGKNASALRWKPQNTGKTANIWIQWRLTESKSAMRIPETRISLHLALYEGLAKNTNMCSWVQHIARTHIYFWRVKKNKLHFYESTIGIGCSPAYCSWDLTQCRSGSCCSAQTAKPSLPFVLLM